MATLRTQATILFGIVALMWMLEIADLLIFHRGLDALGIRPRTASGLLGIVFAPLLHGGFAHLLANTVPFLVLGWLVIARGTSDFVVVTFMVLAIGGLGVWLFGAANTIHIGASGLIFGYLGYLLLRGYFDRRLLSIGIALLVGAVYGGALWGVLPILRYGISWEGHLFGFLGGVAAARVLTERT